jgi:hypothetical protein
MPLGAGDKTPVKSLNLPRQVDRWKNKTSTFVDILSVGRKKALVGKEVTGNLERKLSGNKS